MYLCYGDSITKGSPGVSYLRYISAKQKFKNLGLGGETLIGLNDRINDSLTNVDNMNYIIQIGTNDILLPFLMQYSMEWEKRIEYIIKRGSLPCVNVDQFKEIYTDLIKKLLLLEKNITIINIPCIGEDISSGLNRQVEIYNCVIHKLSIEYGIKYIDFYGWQKSLLKDSQKDESYFISKNPFDVIMDVLLTSLKPVRKRISNKRNLSLTVDGCHLNDAGAKGLAGLVESFL